MYPLEVALSVSRSIRRSVRGLRPHPHEKWNASFLDENQRVDLIIQLFPMIMVMEVGATILRGGGVGGFGSSGKNHLQIFPTTSQSFSIVTVTLLACDGILGPRFEVQGLCPQFWLGASDHPQIWERRPCIINTRPDVPCRISLGWKADGLKSCCIYDHQRIFIQLNFGPRDFKGLLVIFPQTEIPLSPI